MTTPPNADDVASNPAREWAPPDVPPAEPSGVPGAAAPGAPAPPSADPRRTDRTAVAALVTGLIGLAPVAIAFAATALVRLRRGTEKGRALAFGGLAASLAWTVAGTLAVVLVASGSTLERNAAGTITVGGEAPFSELREGDCFTGYEYATPIERLETVTAVPCTEPHTGEIVARMPLPDDAIPSTPDVLCYDRFTYLQKSRESKRLEPYFGISEAAPGEEPGRWVVCAQHYRNGELETRLADTVDTSLKPYQELTPGTCVRSWKLERPIVSSVVPCEEPHWNEVFAKYEFSGDGSYSPGSVPPYPGGAVLYREALRRCSVRAASVFGKVPTKPGLEIDAVPPHPEDWGNGILTVLCTLHATGEGLEGSLLPG